MLSQKRQNLDDFLDEDHIVKVFGKNAVKQHKQVISQMRSLIKSKVEGITLEDKILMFLKCQFELKVKEINELKFD